jgi:hypothetical protein
MTALLLALASLVQAAAPRTDLLVVSGLAGELRFRTAFLETGRQIVEAGEGRLGIAAANVRWLAEDPGADARISGRSTKDRIVAALDSIAREGDRGSRVLIVLLGHGSQVAGDARINLPGPDLSATELAALLSPLGERQVVIVNAASASGDWARALAGPHRVILTATRSGIEQDETVFGRFFAAALASDDADADKDGRLSVLEAFDYARREVARTYERDQRLRTEHALLEADGDGVGEMEPVATNGDGAVAATVFLDAGSAPAVPPALAGLAATKDSLEREVVRLRGRKAQLAPDEYDRRLEALLLELARVTREIKEREGGQP